MSSTGSRILQAVLPAGVGPPRSPPVARHVRELKNIVERAWIMAGEIIDADDIPLARRSGVSRTGTG